MNFGTELIGQVKTKDIWWVSFGFKVPFEECNNLAKVKVINFQTNNLLEKKIALAYKEKSSA